MQVLWNSKVKFVCFSVIGMSPLWVWLWSFHSTMPYFLTWGKKRKKKKKLPADFKPSWMLQAEVVGWASLFSLSMVLRGWGPGLGHALHSCLSSIPVPPFSAGPILPVCTRPAPSIHQLCSPWSAPVRGNSHITFSFFAVLRARHSQSLFRIV